MLFIIIAITAIMGVCSVSNMSYAAVDDRDDGIYFEEPYAAACESITVKCDSSENDLKYVWYVDGERISYNTDEELAITKDFYEKTIKAEVWNESVKVGEASMFCSKLPVLYIDTDGGAEIISKDDYIDAQMHLQGNSLYNADNTTLYTGATEIKGRGNSTWKLFPKKPYKLKLDKKTDLLGMGKNKHWVLLANYIDESCMRNMLAGDIATKLNVGSMNGTWVEVVMNGENLGTYMLCEHVRLSEDRVNVFDWESAAEDIAEAIAEGNGLPEDDMDELTGKMAEEDMSWISTGKVTFKGNTYKTSEYYEDLPDAFSGGYLLEMDCGYDEVSKFTTDNGAPLMFKSPEFICTDEVAMDTVKSYIQTFEDALYSKDFCTGSEGRTVSYTELCDVDSFAGYWLASEMLVNEAGYKSTYFQKDIDQPLVFGPVWDFDYSSGSVSPFGTQDAEDWTSDNTWIPGDNVKWWVREVMKDPYFALKLRNIYIEQEDYFKSIITDGGLLDEWYSYLAEAGNYNYDLWKYANGFEKDYAALLSWLTDRINWMDEQFATNESTMQSMGITFSDKFDLGLEGESVFENSNNAYTVEVGCQDLQLKVSINEEDEFTKLNYYINSKYQGTVDIADGQANIIIREEQLTEDIGNDNVITVWLQDQNGELVEQQYLAVKLISDMTLYNVVFNDMGGTYSSKIPAGEKVYIDGPQKKEENTVFEGWSDGVKTYEVGEWVNVSSDMVLNAVWKTCVDGGYIHEFTDNENDLTCTKEGCSVAKPSDKEYINVRACTIDCSNRYGNVYTGSEIIPDITLTYKGEVLTNGEDYSIEFKNNIDVGYGIYTIKGINDAGYTGELSLSYRIIASSLSRPTITVSKTCILKNGTAIPEVKLVYNGKTLIKDTDYILSYENNTSVGTGKVRITGIGNFSGTITKLYKVVMPPVSVTKCSFTGLADTRVYTGKAIKPVITVKNGTKKLTSGTHYTVSYSNNVKCGTATITIKGVESNGYNGTKKLTFKIRPGKTTAKVVNVKYNEQKVTWSKITGATHYYIYKSSNNKTYKYVKSVKASADRVYKSKGLDAGKTYYYRVMAVRMQDNGDRTAEYWGPKSSVTKLKTVLYKTTITYGKNNASRTATVKWSGVNGAHGYKIYRATSKDGSYKLIKTVKVGLLKKYSNKNLKKGRTYYYKVRAYRVVDDKMVYGAYSSPKAIKITR